jgi:thymidylate kinase
LRRGFAELAAREPERIAVIDANGTEEAVWEAVWKSLKRIR